MKAKASTFVRLEADWVNSYNGQRWARVPSDVLAMLDEDDQDAHDWWDEHDGEMPLVGIDDEQDLSLDEAMYIADYYGGGEFDNECAGIVAALCVLRDHHIKAVPS